MNINSINATSSQQTLGVSDKDTEILSSFKKGEVIEGIITKVSDKVSINFNGREVSASTSTVRDAKEGETRIFKIMDVSKTSIVLKEVGNGIKDTNSASATWTVVESYLTTFSGHQLKDSSDTDKEDEEKDKLDHIVNRMTSADYKDMLAQGMYLEAYGLTRLEDALERIKDQRSLRQVAVEGQVEDIKEVKEQITKRTSVNYKDGVNSDEIIKRLELANLPITEGNVTRISTALELFSKSDKMSDQAKRYMIDKELTPTIEHIYKAQYSGGTSKAAPISDEAWSQIENQAKSIISSSNLEINESSLQNARWILDNELPLTGETLKKLNSLNEIADGIDDDMVLDKIISAIENKIAPESTSLEVSILDVATKIVKDIASISDEAVDKAVRDNEVINLQNLKAAQYQLLNPNNEPVKVENQVLNKDITTGIEDIDIKAVTAKRQLEEIRLRMTMGASSTLIKNGMDINTESLLSVIERLKEIEDRYYSGLLQDAGAVGNLEEVSLLRDTTNKVNELKEMPSYIIGSRSSYRSVDTLNELHTSGSSLKAQLDKASSTYDTLMTSPRKDLGDTIEKAFNNIDHILDEMNLEITEANQRAVKILGYNNMAITQENITKVKAYDSQVNRLMESINPSVAVHLIKEGINPLDTPIDELNNQITAIKEELGLSEEEKYSKYLWKLEKEDGLTPKERKAYIGIYRLFNNIEKSNGKAVGSVINANQEVTLNNLLTAVRTSKSKGIDEAIDDRFGALESLSFSKESITDQLDGVFNLEASEEELDKITYMNSLVSLIGEEITPSKVRQIGEEGDILDLSLERFKEELAVKGDNLQIDEDYYKEKIASFREVGKDSLDSISLLENLDITNNITNLNEAKQYIANHSNKFKDLTKHLYNKSEESIHELENVIDGFMEALDDRETMTAQYEKFDKGVSEILNKQYENQMITAKDIADIKSLSQNISFMKELSKKECYEIPISQNGQITNMNLTIINGTDETSKIGISYESNILGKVEINLVVKDGVVKGLINSNDANGLWKMESEKTNLQEALESLGLNAEKLDYGMKNQRSDTNGYVNLLRARDTTKEDVIEEKASTKVLYKTAKAFVVHIKEVEGGKTADRSNNEN